MGVPYDLYDRRNFERIQMSTFRNRKFCVDDKTINFNGSEEMI